MVNTAIVGCNGKMGCFVAQAVQSREDCNVLFGVDAFGESNYDFDVFKTFDEATETPDVIIDFSNPAALDGMLSYAVDNKVPCVICTTGFSKDQIAKIEDAAKTIPVFYSGNMSLGINMLMELLKKAALTLAPAGFDMEIVEKHHKLKCDAPSGTAIALADSLNEAMDNQYHYVYDRSQRHEQRDPKEIGISAVRGGTIVGDHDVIFAGPDEVVILSHRAYSKGVFGKGAVEAAKFLAGKPAGMYDMQDVIAAK